MRFTVAVSLFIAAAQTSAFTIPSANPVAFTSTAVKSVSRATRRPRGVFCRLGCLCDICTGRVRCRKGCNCGACTGGLSFALRMSDASESEPVEDEPVPEVVASMDGIGGAEEAHNAERPQRASGTAKHKDRKKGKPISELEVGQEVTGKVKTITSYGAFVNIGYASDALLHISRMSDDFVSDVNEVVKEGQEVTVRIFSVDKEKNQVSITMRSAEKEAEAVESRNSKRKSRPQRSGGDRAAQSAAMAAMASADYDDDKFVEGEVVSMLDFGAFVRVDTAQVADGLSGEIDGLVHISALTKERVDSVASIVSIGDKVQVRVKSVDGDAGKVSLSMISKADEPPPRKRREGGNKADGKREWRGPEGDMGEADWKNIVENMEQPAFSNSFVLK